MKRAGGEVKLAGAVAVVTGASRGIGKGCALELGAEDFRDFTFTNAVRFYTRVNPDFFRGTRIEADAAAVVAGERGT